MGNTANGYPYPEDTDLVAQGAQGIKALANAIDTRARATAAGVVTIGLSNANNGSVAVTFPAGRFATTPAVTATSEDGTMFAAAYSRTATGCRVFVRQFAGTAVTGSIVTSWVAVGVG